jgi:hypothetical protein
VEKLVMATKSAQEDRRNFNPMLAPNLSDEARKAVNEAFDSLSTWRTETLSSSEKNCEQVIEKMATAARELGWPKQIVDVTREQLQNITKMQIETLDRMMDAWEEQIKAPDPITASSAMLGKLKSLPSFSPAGAWPNAAALQNAGMNPFQLYAQVMQQWQKAWTDAMGFWAKAGKPDDTVGPRPRH